MPELRPLSNPSVLPFLQSLPSATNLNELINHIEIFNSLLAEWNQKINLVSPNELSKIWPRHHCDALEAVRAFPKIFQAQGLIKIVDVGSGAGFPGFTLSFALPQAEVDLLESIQKKCEFHRAVIDHLRLARVHSLCDRAEAVGQQPDRRESYDIAVTRALANPGTILELVLPLVKVGGTALFWGSTAEWANSSWHAACELLGGSRLSEYTYALSDSPQSQRSIIAIEKKAPTPTAYPRRIGVPAKRPLSK